jgi:hypothetical protein
MFSDLDIIDLMILFFKSFVYAVILGVISLFFIYPIYYLIFGDRPGAIISSGKELYVTYTYRYPDWTKVLFFLVLIFFTLMYIIYLIIITIIPETGFLTLFIPFREMLLKIPPLPSLIDKGVFYMYDSVIGYYFGSEGFENFKNKCHNHLYNNKHEIYDVIKLFNPKLNIEKFANLIENMNNNNKKSERKNVNNDVAVCIGNNSPLTTPDMNYTQLANNTFTDIKSKIKCNLNAIPTYIATEE